MINPDDKAKLLHNKNYSRLYEEEQLEKMIFGDRINLSRQKDDLRRELIEEYHLSEDWEKRANIAERALQLLFSDVAVAEWDEDLDNTVDYGEFYSLLYAVAEFEWEESHKEELG